MSLAVKAGVVGAASAAGATGTYFLVWGVDYMPEYTLLSAKTDKSGYSGKLGADYEYFLVDPDTSDNKNKLWWEWSYRRWLEDSQKGGNKTSLFSTEFQNVKKDDSDQTDTSSKTIDKVCDDVYKKSSTDFDFGTGEDNKYKLGRDLLKYCSPLGAAPETVRNDDQYGDGKLAKDKKSELVSTYGNGVFWNLRTDWFNGQATKPTSDKFFEPFLDSSNGNKLKTSLRVVCEKAYRAKETIGDSGGEATEAKPKESEIVKYCSFKKTS